jgi:hypothetical protein
MRRRADKGVEEKRWGRCRCRCRCRLRGGGRKAAVSRTACLKHALEEGGGGSYNGREQLGQTVSRVLFSSANTGVPRGRYGIICARAGRVGSSATPQCMWGVIAGTTGRSSRTMGHECTRSRTTAIIKTSDRAFADLSVVTVVEEEETTITRAGQQQPD